MQALEETFEAACVEGKIPGAVLVASNTSCSFTYGKAFGLRSLALDQKAPAELNTIFPLFSATKLITTIAALQLVERGKVKLDDDVAQILPEIAEQQVLKSMENGTPAFARRQNPITLR